MGTPTKTVTERPTRCDDTFDLSRAIDLLLEKRVLTSDGNPNFSLKVYALNRKGEYAGVSLYAETRMSWEDGPGKEGKTEPARYAVCTDAGPQTLDCDALLGVQAPA